MATALITGASAGIGSAFCDLLAKQGFDLVLVARDQSRLNAKAETLRSAYAIAVEVLPADLSQPEQLLVIEKRLSESNRPIDVLINNAGFGIKESFLRSDIDLENQLLDVLVRAPMRLMHAILPSLKSRNSGTIINVSSVASWITSGSYSACKSYLTVLSESMHTELIGTGVRVSALCPGFTHTEFHERGKMKMTGLPEFMWLTADRVVQQAWTAAEQGKAICVPGVQYLILSTIARFGPRPFVRRMGIKIRVRQRGKK